MATPNAPDALGGIGYANIFEGSPAIEDWRDDLRYGSAVKAKKAADDAARQAALKLPEIKLEGWDSADLYELNAMHDALVKAGADMIANGQDPMKNPKYRSDMDKAIRLGLAAQEQQALFNTGMADLQNMYDKGDISPETYAQKRQEWIDYKKAGVPDNQVGRMYSRLQLEPPESPATIPDMIAFIQKNQDVLEKKKEMKSFPTASGMQHTTKGVPQTVIDEQIAVMEQDPLWGRFSPDQQEQIKKAIVVGSEVSDKPLSDKGGFNLNIGGGISQTGDWEHKVQDINTETINQYLGEEYAKGFFGGESLAKKFNNTDAISEKFIGSKTATGKEVYDVSKSAMITDTNGNKIDAVKARPTEFTPSFTVRDNEGKIWTIGNAVIVDKGQRIPVTVMDEVTIDRKPQYEHAFYTDGGKTQDIDELLDEVNKARGKSDRFKIKPQEAKQTNDFQEFVIGGKTYRIPSNEVAEFKKAKGIK